MRTPKNALVRVTMLASWAGYDVGESVEFDAVRAKWLCDNGLAVTGDQPASPAPKPRLAPRRTR